MLDSNVFVDKFIFWDTCRVERTVDHVFPLHSTAINRFDDVDEILFAAECSNELRVIGSSRTNVTN